jgi:hypothetical protein
MTNSSPWPEPTSEGAAPAWHITECLVPGVTATDAAEMGRRIAEELGQPDLAQVRFLGSLLVPEDEVLLFVFAGPHDDVRVLTDRAGLPYERVVGCVGFGWFPAV